MGGALLSEASESLVGSAEAIAAGAVLAVISISIVPYAFSEVSSLVATATVLGFGRLPPQLNQRQFIGCRTCEGVEPTSDVETAAAPVRAKQGQAQL